MKDNTAATSYQQQRGQKRRQKIIDTCCQLLKKQSIETISLADIATLADIPKSSIYHFYPAISAVLEDVMQVFAQQLAQTMMLTIDEQPHENWQSLVDKVISASALFYQQHPQFQQLVLSGKAPSQLKLQDRAADNLLAQGLLAKLQQLFILPEWPQQAEVFFNAVEIVDLFLSLNYQRQQQLTPQGIAECQRACKSYLRSYLPEYLMPRGPIYKEPLQQNS